MAGGKVYGSSNMTVLLQNEKLPSSSDVLESLWIPSSSPTFHGSSSMVSFENVCDKSLNTDRPFFQKEEACDDDYDGCFLQPGKKRRLSVDQVQFLERNFEVENKLEPERKVQLAKELGLQPRQVAIWFQNRRARYKTKQLEKDYDVLKSSYDKLQSEYDNLLKEKDKLKEEVLFLKDKLLIRDNGKLQDLDLDNQVMDQEPQEHVPKTVPETGSDSAPPMLVCKQEDASSAKSDVLDSDSPHYATHSNSLLEPTTADSSNVFESDFSQDEDDDNFSRSFLPAPPLPAYLPRLDDDDGHFQNPHAGSASSCNFGFPVEDQLFCFWP